MIGEIASPNPCSTDAPSRPAADRTIGPVPAPALIEYSDRTPSGHLDRIVRTAVAEIDGARWVTVMVPNNGVMTTVAASDRIAQLIDQTQRDTDDGPVLTMPPLAGAVVHSCDLIADRRWPRFAPLAHQLGAGAALCHRIGTRAGPAGVLSVYADRPYAFSVDSDRVARLLAVYAGIALDAEALQRNLRVAARSRDLIGQAKGILMERLRVSPDEAFATLVARSQTHRMSVGDVADHLVSTGELP